MESPYSSDYEELSMEDNNNNNHGDSRVFKSKNLDAERRRRAKLNERLLQLRAIVPIITNMTKAYIIKDAITYIEELDSQVSELKDELMELGNSTPKEEIKAAKVKDEKNSKTQEMIKNHGIEPEVKVVPIDDNKIWIKVVYEDKMGGFSKLVETITRLGLEFNDTNLTTSNGAAVISSCLEGMSDGCLQVEEATELITSVINSL